MICECTIAALVLLITVIYLISPLFSPKPIKINGKHVLITGGSSGIGKELAIAAVKKGANVTILARNKTKLEEAKKEIENNANGQTVLAISVDISSDYEVVEKAVKDAENELGPVTMLVNSAGMAATGVFEDVPVSEFQRIMSLNYIGSVYTTRAVIRGMKARKEGRIVFLSSQAGQVGVFGFTAYSPSKFALRGLAEALQMEVKAHNIRVTVVFPPDTDTPGLHEENKTKPKETILISETSGLFQADYVAKVILNDALAGKYQCYIGMDGWMIAQLTAGMSPVTSLMEGLQQCLLSGLFRFISLFYLASFDSIVRKCKAEREQGNKGDKK